MKKIIMILLVLVLLSACSIDNSENNSENRTSSDSISVMEFDVASFTDFSMNVKKSPFILVGEFIDESSEEYLGSLGDDQGGYGKGYLFKIDQVLKGKIDKDVIAIVQEKSFVNDNGESVDFNFYPDPQSNKKMVVFIGLTGENYMPTSIAYAYFIEDYLVPATDNPDVLNANIEKITINDLIELINDWVYWLNKKIKYFFKKCHKTPSLFVYII